MRNIQWFDEQIKKIENLLGIADKAEPISFEISEFIQEAQNSLEKLPKKYQKIYGKTSDKTDFLCNRKEELEQLKSMYEHWEKDRFVSCAIVAQKGAGVTSMLEMFFDTNPTVEVIRGELHEKIWNKEEYFNYFNTLLKTEQISTNQDFIEHLNDDTKERKIIVLEHLQHFFLKKVGGFEAIKLLFDLISYTTKNVLWIGVFTPVPWNYLDKTISLSDYFTNVIRVGALSSEHIEQTIALRNKSALLEVVFTTKQDEEKTQESLKKEFFKQLNKLSNANISLALLYWVRAIEKIEKKTLYINPIDELDSSFVKNLSTENLFILQALLIHDGLTLKDYSEITNTSAQESRKKFMTMLEKGLLIQPKEKYNINPAIYEHIYKYLSSKNYIH